MPYSRAITPFWIVLLTLIAAAIAFLAIPVPHDFKAVAASDADAAELRRYAEYLGEFTNRRRANIYFQNNQSIFHGAQVNWVNVGRGNLTFLRRDLVTPGRIPIVIARVYDSSATVPADFGLGWHLSAAERIELSDGTARLFTEGGSALEYAEQSGGYALKLDHPSDYPRIAHGADGTLQIAQPNGATREYASIAGAYRLRRVTDRNGNAILLHYSGALISRIENATHAVDILRDSAGRITSVRDDLNRSLSYAYDDRGLLTTVNDLGGNTWTYQYASQKQLHKAFDPVGRENFKVWYGTDGKVQSVELPSGRIAYQYGTPVGCTTVVDRKSLTSIYCQSSDGITTRIVNALGEETAVVLDAARNVTEFRENGVLRQVLGYDDSHRVVTRQAYRPTGQTSYTYSYTPPGWLESITAGNGSTRTLSYDSRGNLTSADNSGVLENFSYTPAGDLSAMSASGQNYSIETNADGQITQFINQNSGEQVEIAYENGRAKNVIQNGGSPVTMAYDSVGLRREYAYTDPRAARYTMDPSGNLTEISITNYDGSTGGQALTLDSSYQVVEQRLSNGEVIYLKYDQNGNLIEARNGTSVTRFEYDGLNRLKAVVTADGRRLEHTYQPGDRSLVDENDYASGVWASDRRDSGFTFGSYAEVFANRDVQSQFGTMRISASLGRFEMSGTYGEILLPNVLVKRPLANWGLLSQDPHGAHGAHFLRPSNRLYLPAEYTTINCCPLCPYPPQPWCSEGCDPGGGGITPTLTCMQGTERGSSATCTLSADLSAIVSNWRFEGPDNVTVSRGSSSSRTWSGIVVVGGVVKVDVDGNLVSDALTVLPRSGFSFTAVSATEQSDGYNCGDGFDLNLPNPPSATGDAVGKYCLIQRWNFAFSTVSGGPNHNYKYITSVGSSGTAYHWATSPELQNPNDPFSLAQCGSYNSQTNPNGYISRTNLLANAIRHESGTVESHYKKYLDNQNAPANNIGAVAEALVKYNVPVTTFESFVNGQLDAKRLVIQNGTQTPEPCSVNHSSTCTFQGYINFYPYNQCIP